MTPTIDIAGRTIGEGHPAYIIAELSGNHRQQFDDAVRLIEAAAAAGADAVKLQTYTADTITIDADGPHFRIGDTQWKGRRLYDLYAEASTPWPWHADLAEVARQKGLHLFSTPFDHTAVDFLEALQVPAYKVASFEIVDIPLLRKVASTGKPVIVSTGMASLPEIGEAVSAVRDTGTGGLALLKCTSAYPAPAASMNLRTIPHLSQTFGVPVGLSDHTLDVAVPVTAVTLGACIVEKHLTLERALGGPDAAFSLEPAEFAAMVAAIRTSEAAAGAVQYSLNPDEESMRPFRRSLFVVEAMKAGDVFSSRNVRSIRPGGGLHTRHLDEVIGRRAACDIVRGTPLAWDLVE